MKARFSTHVLLVPALLFGIELSTTSAQSRRPPAVPTAPAPSLNIDAIWPTPHMIVTRILNAYIERRQPDFALQPLVDRLRRALERTDLATDFILKGPSGGDGKEPGLNAFRLVETKTLDGKRQEITAWTLLARQERRLVFVFDVTSGDWLITDIRDGHGSLRQELQITPSLNLRP